MKRKNKFPPFQPLKMKALLILFVGLFAHYGASSQVTATVTGGNCAGSFSLSANGMVNGRNQYSGSVTIFGFGVPVNLNWSGSQWQIITATGAQVAFSNPTDISPNPPCHNNGVWTAGGSCAGGSLTGSMGDCAAVVPVELVSFNAQNKDKTNELSWLTASEVANKGFAIERSADGKTWKQLDFVTTKGNGARYNFVDNTPLSISYYRLVQQDFDGAQSISKTVSVNLSNTKNPISISPNPVKNNMLHIDGLSSEKSAISITNIYGQSVYNQSFTSSTVDISLPLAAGIYCVVVKNGTTIFTQKMIKE